MRSAFVNQRGLGFLEVVILAGILGVIVTGLSAITVTSQKRAHTIEKSAEYDELIAEVQQIINSPTLCNNNFAGVTLAAGGQPIALTFGPFITFDNAANSNFQGGKIKILNLQLTPPTIAAGVATSAVSVQASLQGNGTAVVGSSSLTTTLPISFNVTGAVVTTCSGSVASSYKEQFWTFTGCFLNSGGNHFSCFAGAALPTAMPDTTYTVECSSGGGNAGHSPSAIISVLTASKTTGGFNYVAEQVMSNGGGHYSPVIMCHAHHN